MSLRPTPKTHVLLVGALLLIGLVLAATSLLRDSATFDEPFHLAAGYSQLLKGDFRLSPDHPPLARAWAALPLLLMNVQWVPADDIGWIRSDSLSVSRRWLYNTNPGDSQNLIVAGRWMMLPILVGLWLTIYAAGRMLVGPGAGLLALILAVLDPTLLAHGRLVTTDVPATLAFLLVIVTTARLLQCITWPRTLAAAAALGAASVAKLSWPLILPAVAAMLLLATIRRTPLAVRLSGASGGRQEIAAPAQRAAHLLLVTVLVGIVTWASVWTAYGWRSTIIAPLPPAASAVDRTREQMSVDVLRQLWANALLNPDNTARQGLIPAFVQWAADAGILPEPYLLGLAKTAQFAESRKAFFLGAYGDKGWWLYFPLAFLIKTPVVTQLFLLAGVVAIVWRRGLVRDHALLLGLAVFSLVYGGLAVSSSMNIGQRHLLPLYPVVCVLGGAAVAWAGTRWARWIGGGLLLWLLAANLWIYPHYLAYFNELVGGPANGHRYLLDSNIDWGQDLLRLRAYAARQAGSQVKLGYFGSAVPSRYLDCAALPSSYPYEPVATLDAGTYVMSVTQLFGVYDVELRSAYWTAERLAAYGQLGRRITSEPDTVTPEERAQYARWRVQLLIARLAQRPPDDRVGWSLFVYHLTAADVAELTCPQEAIP